MGFEGVGEDFCRPGEGVRVIGRHFLDQVGQPGALSRTMLDQVTMPLPGKGNQAGPAVLRVLVALDQPGFGQPMDGDVKGRLAGMRGGLSTRMGAAMRHGAHHLRQRSERHKLLLVLTDGEPADIDERDPHYLRSDAGKAVAELRKDGISTYCLTLDPEADRYVSRIFGPTNYTIIDKVERLPEKLPMLFANLTK